MFGTVEALPKKAGLLRVHRRKGDSTQQRAVTLSRTKSLAEELRNRSLTMDPQFRLPLRIILPVTVGSAMYCVCRAYILIEDFISLRRLPATSYDTVNWSRYLPHF